MILLLFLTGRGFEDRAWNVFFQNQKHWLGEWDEL